MIPRSLRVRAIVAASLAVLFALVVVGAGIDLLVARHLHRSLDRSLHARAVEVAQLSASAPALLTTPGSLDTAIGGEQVSVEVLDRRGRIVARSLGLGGRVLPVQPLWRAVIADGAGRYAATELGGDDLRVYVAPLADAGGPAAGGAVVVAASLRDLNATLADVHLVVLLAALAAAAAGAVAVALLMRSALRPLGQLADAAAEIERTGDPARRLPEPDAGDEVGGLAHTLNQMLAALERSRDAERRFLADASHELRTPLTALIGNIDYLARHGADPQLVEDLEHDSRRLARLADDLLALSREEAASPPPDEDVRLDELARESTGVDVVAPEPVTVRGDRAALERALANLVENAHRHGRGRVVVEVGTTNGVARLTVEDEGVGVTGEEAEQVFARFQRGRDAGPGSGLGLALVRATAERHGGRAYAEGSRFTIELPRLRDVSESRATTSVDREKGSPS